MSKHDIWVGYDERCGYFCGTSKIIGGVQVRVSDETFEWLRNMTEVSIEARAWVRKAYRAGWNIESLTQFHTLGKGSPGSIKEELLNETETAWRLHEILWWHVVEHDLMREGAGWLGRLEG